MFHILSLSLFTLLGSGVSAKGNCITIEALAFGQQQATLTTTVTERCTTLLTVWSVKVDKTYYFISIIELKTINCTRQVK